jgi:hypothetical protein
VGGAEVRKCVGFNALHLGGGLGGASGSAENADAGTRPPTRRATLPDRNIFSRSTRAAIGRFSVLCR